jgi:hypothetical protein
MSRVWHPEHDREIAAHSGFVTALRRSLCEQVRRNALRPLPRQQVEQILAVGSCRVIDALLRPFAHQQSTALQKRSKLRIGRDDVHQNVQARHFVAGAETPLAHNRSNLEAIEEWQLSYINPS